jgi:hypothetical protein
MNERGHLSAETLDLLALSALAGQESTHAQSHLQGCAACKQRWEELNEDKQRFEQFVFPRTLPQVEARARRGALGATFWERWRIWAPAIAAVSAAVIALVAVPRMSQQPYLGLKGGSTLEVVARRGDQQFEVKAGARLKPKDQIRFVIQPGASKFLLITSRDGRGNFSVYYPYGGSQSAGVEPNRQELPGSIELDDAVGPERLYALFSDSPLSAETIRTELARRGEQLEGLPGVRDAVTLEFVKDPP